MEITDGRLLRIALITSLIGLIGLIIFTPSIEVKQVKISDINRAMIDEEVSVEGVVGEVKSSKSGGSYFLTVNDGTGKINLIIFESQLAEVQRDFDIGEFKDRKVKITGKITEYNSQMEIILSGGDGIEIIN